jgi:hypothetical protein
MDKFVVRESQTQGRSDNEAINLHDDETEVEAENIGEQVLIDSTNIQVANHDHNQAVDDNMDTTDIEVNSDSSQSLDDDNQASDSEEDNSFQPGIYDPRYWDSLSPSQVVILAKNGPRRDLSLQKVLQNMLPKNNMGPAEILKFIKRHGCYPNTDIAYRILLTIPVTVASAERSFSKLKLLKSFLRSTMTQERLNDLALIALEGDILKEIAYEDIIEDFISKNATRIMYFK